MCCLVDLLANLFQEVLQLVLAPFSCLGCDYLGLGVLAAILGAI